MTDQKTESLKQLFYDFYIELLNLYKKDYPQVRLVLIKDFETKENGYQINEIPKVKLIKNSYYWKHREQIWNLNSFKKIVEFIESDQNLLDSDNEISDSPNKSNIGKKYYLVRGLEESFGAHIYGLGEDLFEKFNSPTISQIKTDFSQINLSGFDVNDADLKNRLNKKGTYNFQKHYYFIENFKLNSDKLDFKIESINVSIKKLDDNEKKLILNGDKFGSIALTNNIGRIECALVSDVVLEEVFVKNIIALLRIFKKGTFRFCFVGNLRNDSMEEVFFINSFSNIIEAPIAEINLGFFDEGYEILKNEEELLCKHVVENYDNLKNCAFAVSCLSKIHSLEESYKIPFLFFILESFFKKIDTELVFRISFLVSKIIDEDYEFITKIKKIYSLRSKVVHGSYSEDKKFLQKIDQNFQTVKDVRVFLEEVVRKVWKNLLDQDLLEDNVDIEKIYFSKNINKLETT